MNSAMTDEDLAMTLAEKAGALLLDIRLKSGLSGKALGGEGDLQANRLIIDALRALRPEDGLLSEEEKDNPARLSHARVWIIDPLDGTREYGEGRADWAVHVALSLNGQAAIGAVALPAQGRVLSSADRARLYQIQDPPRMVASRTRPPPEAEIVAAHLGAEIIPMGSAGAKIAAVVTGDAAIYVHAGGQYEWDSCAPVAVARAAGLHVSRLNGDPLVYNRPDPSLPDLLVCTPSLAGAALACLRQQGLYN